MKMSKYGQKIYSHTLKYPHRRCVTSKLRRERPLWKEIEPCKIDLYQKAFNILCILAIVIATLGLFLYFFDLNFFDILFYVIIVFSLAAVATFLSMFRCHSRNYLKKQNIGNRSPVKFEDFYARICESKECPEGLVKAIRETIGYMYCVSSDMICVDDTPVSLQAIGGGCDPFGYELIIGVATKLKIELTDTNVDSISEKVYHNAKNVEDIILIICDELVVVPTKNSI
jgi:hypothetical protein